MDNIERATEVALQFTEAMKEWETIWYAFGRIEGDKPVSKEHRKLVGDSTRELLDRQCYQLLDLYCSQKKKKYGGHPYSLANQQSIQA